MNRPYTSFHLNITLLNDEQQSFLSDSLILQSIFCMFYNQTLTHSFVSLISFFTHLYIPLSPGKTRIIRSKWRPGCGRSFKICIIHTVDIPNCLMQRAPARQNIVMHSVSVVVKRFWQEVWRDSEIFDDSMQIESFALLSLLTHSYVDQCILCFWYFCVCLWFVITEVLYY